MKTIILFLLTLLLCEYSFAQIPAIDFTVNGEVFQVTRRNHTFSNGSFGITVAKQGSPLFNNAPYPSWFVRPTEECYDVNGGKADVVSVYNTCRIVFPVRRCAVISNHTKSLTILIYLKADGTVYSIHYSMASYNVFTPQELLQLDTLLKQKVFRTDTTKCFPNNITAFQMQIYFSDMHTDPAAFGLGPDWENARP